MTATRAANKSVVTFTLFASFVIVARLTDTVVTARRICTRNSSKFATENAYSSQKNFYINPHMSYQNSRVWERGRKANLKPSCLLVEREKCAKHVMVSAGECFGGKGWPHVVEEKAKVNCACYVGNLLPNLVDDCSAFIF